MFDLPTELKISAIIVFTLLIGQTASLVSAEPTIKIFHANGTETEYSTVVNMTPLNNSVFESDGVYTIITESGEPTHREIKLYVNEEFVGSYDKEGYFWRGNRDSKHITNFDVKQYFHYRLAIDEYNKFKNRTVLWIMNKPSPYCSKCFSLWVENEDDKYLTDFWNRNPGHILRIDHIPISQNKTIHTDNLYIHSEYIGSPNHRL